MTSCIKSIGKFQVLGTLGTGAQSTILHIRRSADAKHYALKVVPAGGEDNQKYLEQARHEYRVARLLDHPNLIKIFTLEMVRDWLLRPKTVHLLIEYVNGRTLDSIGRIPVPRLVQIFVQVAAGLVQMHRRGIFHADLKPNNILLGRAGEVKIIDFGLAWLRSEKKGRVQGTPEYMAPEQVKQKIVNEQTDIYNFGATLYRLVTLRHPPQTFVVGTDLALDTKTQAQLMKPVQECNPEAPAALCDLIHRCLAPKPVNRPERMSEVQSVLDHLADELACPTDGGLEDLD